MLPIGSPLGSYLQEISVAIKHKEPDNLCFFSIFLNPVKFNQA